MDTFSIRPYCEETDFDILYDFHCDYASKTLAYQLSGASPYIPKEIFRDALKNTCKYSRYPFVVADDGNNPIGISKVEQYVRVGKHHTIYIKLWKKAELTEQVLAQTMQNIFESRIVKMVICKVEGCEKELVEACRKLGLQQVGCIPEYFCYEGKLYPEYTFIATRNMIEP